MSQVKMVLNNAGTVSLVTSRQISLTHNKLLPNRNKKYVGSCSLRTKEWHSLYIIHSIMKLGVVLYICFSCNNFFKRVQLVLVYNTY
jgi:hypothetical protein